MSARVAGSKPGARGAVVLLGDGIQGLPPLHPVQDPRSLDGRAYALDNMLVPPDMSADVPVSSTPKSSLSPAQKSPLSALLVLVALGIFSGTVSVFRKKIRSF